MGPARRAHLRRLVGVAHRPESRRRKREGSRRAGAREVPGDRPDDGSRQAFIREGAGADADRDRRERRRLVEVALVATGAQLERICRRYRSFAAEGGVPGLEPAALDPSCDERGVRVWTTDAGHMRIEVTLDASDATLVLAAIDKVRDELRAVTGSTNRVSAETRGGLNDATPMPGRLDGVIAIAERTLAPTPQTADFSDGAPVPQHQVVIHLDQSVLEPE